LQQVPPLTSRYIYIYMSYRYHPDTYISYIHIYIPPLLCWYFMHNICLVIYVISSYRWITSLGYSFSDTTPHHLCFHISETNSFMLLINIIESLFKILYIRNSFKTHNFQHTCSTIWKSSIIRRPYQNRIKTVSKFYCCSFSVKIEENNLRDPVSTRIGKLRVEKQGLVALDLSPCFLTELMCLYVCVYENKIK
jgi:hypothetical protein